MAAPYAQVIPLLPIDREMTYHVPEDLRGRIEVGSRVLIPLGARWTTGIVAGFQDHCDIEEVRSVGDLLDASPAVSPKMLDLCRWIAGYYLCPLGEALKAALPAGIHTDSGQRIALADAHTAGLPDGAVSQRQREVLDFLKSSGGATLRQIERRCGRQGTRSAVYGLMRRGLLRSEQAMFAPRVEPKRERTVGLIPQDPRWMEVALPQLERRAPRQADCIRRLWAAGGTSPVRS